MEFAIHYENIPFFCFWCGRIGHDKRECPEEIPEVGGVHFGEALRCSPQKRDVGRRQTLKPLESNARRSLNFCGVQKEKVRAAASFSSHHSGGWSASHNLKRGRDVQGWQTGGGNDGLYPRRGNPEDMENELSMGVKNLAMNSSLPDLNAMASEVVEDSKDRVSGLNSYNGMSELPTSGDSK